MHIAHKKGKVMNALIGVIGGSGLYDMPGLQRRVETTLTTPYGSPSEILVQGELAGVPVAFLARHGRGHRLLPSEVPYRANIHALAQLGVRYLLSISAVGSLREDIAPLDLVLPDQFIDLTRHRACTFFGNGAVAHVSMADPVCEQVHHALAESVRELAVTESIRLHVSGTYLCIEGPQFSSRAESMMYRQWGASIIGMTNMPEARLAREAQMAYASLAMVTDYDCWHPREAHVTAETAIANLQKNAQRAQEVIALTVARLGQGKPHSRAHNSLAQALVTPWEAMDSATHARLAVFKHR